MMLNKLHICVHIIYAHGIPNGIFKIIILLTFRNGFKLLDFE